jgi:guanylate kinase
MLFAIVGESGSGKTRIQNKLMENGMQKIVTYTTRPRRADEINHIDYHFVSEKEFKRELLDKNLLIEHAIYNDWHYGFSLDGINYSNQDFVIVLTPSGLHKLHKTVGEKDILSIYLNVHERERLLRLTKRGDHIDEIFRRIMADRLDFKGIQRYVNMVVNEREVDGLVGKLLAINKRGVQDDRET